MKPLCNYHVVKVFVRFFSCFICRNFSNSFQFPVHTSKHIRTNITLCRERVHKYLVCQPAVVMLKGNVDTIVNCLSYA